MKRTLIACFMAAVAGCLSAGAQTGEEKNTIMLASSSASHPNERPQWTKEQAEAWFDKVGVIKGINHPTPPCSAVSQDEALNLAHKSGYNSVRWFIGGSSTQEYINNVENAAQAAWKYGMTIAPVFTFAHIPTSYTDSLALASKVRQIIKKFRNDERVIMWDLWNEPAMYDTTTPKIMETIRLMAQWCREEGCTQAITSSIIWDSGIGTTGGEYAKQRNAAEAEMDVHNFHDYSMQQDHSANVASNVARLKAISDRPIICTEVMTRPNGSTLGISLRECAKYKIAFYSWGLYTCDSNWDVTWNKSTYYAYEPNFHCLYYAGGDPMDRREAEYVKNFKYTEEQIYPGVEETERWTERRAWKWMADEPLKIRYAYSVAEANSFINSHTTSNPYNCIAVRLSLKNYSSGSSSYIQAITSMASKASNAGMRVLPVLITSSDLSSSTTTLKNYAYNMINSLYNDRRFAGWCLFEQTAESEPTDFHSQFSELFSYVRYSFPNQPIFACPIASTAATADSTANSESVNDFTNYMWQLSDVVAFKTADGTEASAKLLNNLQEQYNRPLFYLNATKLQNEFASNHVNWATSSDLSASEIDAFKFSPLNITSKGDTCKMPSWKAWAQMNRGPVKGLYYKSIAAAKTGIAAQGPKGIYNSVAVQMNYDTYNRTRDTFISDFEALLDSAGKYNMTVVPMLLNDTYGKRSQTSLLAYITHMISTYDSDPRILAWELYNRPGTVAGMQSTLNTLVPKLFATARAQSPNRPLFITPYVTIDNFADGFDYENMLAHFGGGGGWNYLKFGNAGINLVYMCWQLSDICSLNSGQNSPELGWINSIAYKFGRPVICTRWETANSTTIEKTLDVFADHHEPWFVDGTVDDSLVKDFKYQTVITNH